MLCPTSGCSMRPFLRSGVDLAYIECKKQSRCRKYDVVLYRRQTGKYVLHRIVKVCPDSYTLCGDNCWQREPGITDAQILGVLTGVIREGRRVDVNSRRYRALVRVWCACYPIRGAFLYLREKVWSVWKKVKAAIKHS